MLQTAIFWPLIAQTALIYAIYLVASSRRMGAVKNGTAKAQDFKIPIIEPGPSATAIRSLSNQFELPVLFYVVCILLSLVNGVNTLTLLLAWIFVLTRVFHAFVHVTSNRLRLRRPAFIAGLLVNLVLWVALALKLAGVGAV